ncbi:iron-siderophore ABC transporter substrate-binding protein [Streptomyces antarcticus]|uniref:iron-siderophore ABC transporter substrate-binding protein n=1 Tax=Streptomyces antarcticus TaxID=2996458 RepID=UPI0022722D12|nr:MULTISPECIES: iron-siderophore ABC transporter substrate-binding protein [unclassified Streptomyces]MCY0939909.1 iron-siderophore ABC transporter substrate-binding protein [Streptomyces sp. H34-AA3]MCY0949987.1 iron-siderophore ABC transporter substrate-binding protein [Streptomyces sp. H27-S2]MCZ4086900.1 iron-siderophore ABC transporter substrate-binding protein [Streptomyces sp. H34-S5]
MSVGSRPALTRIVRNLPRVAVAAAAALVLSACGGGEEKTESKPSGEASGGTSSAAFPVTVEHKYGSTTIDAEPKKVVTLGLSDQDAVLALGVKPVGAVDWFKETPYGKWQWSKDLWGSTPPQVVGERDEYNMEKIAALKPDLIIAQYSGMKKEQYDTLSKIAKVVAQPKGAEDYQATWQVMTQQIGKSLGKEAETQKLIAGIDARFKTVRDKHPEWKDKTVAVGEPVEPGKFSAFSPKDPKVIFLSEMGFTTSEAYRTALGKDNIADLSSERFDVMEADRTVWLGTPDTEAAMKADPLYAKTKVNQEKRDLFLPYDSPDIGAALSFNTVLSIPYAIDQVVPKLEAIK